MRGLKSTSLALVCALGVSAFCVQAEQKSANLRQAVDQRLDDRTSMPLLKGGVWLQMDDDQKIAFLWGSAHVIAIERELADRYPELNQADFSQKVAQGMPKMGLYEISAKVDQFYRGNPDKIDMPVLAVIWESLVKPNLSAGIANKPLN